MLLEDYPEMRGNLRITGLRGVGKTVLLKEFERMVAVDDLSIGLRGTGTLDAITAITDAADPATLRTPVEPRRLSRSSSRRASRTPPCNG